VRSSSFLPMSWSFGLAMMLNTLHQQFTIPTLDIYGGNDFQSFAAIHQPMRCRYIGPITKLHSVFGRTLNTFVLHFLAATSWDHFCPNRVAISESFGNAEARIIGARRHSNSHALTKTARPHPVLTVVQGPPSMLRCIANR
jgi:hypothetical protein